MGNKLVPTQISCLMFIVGSHVIIIGILIETRDFSMK